MHYTCIVIWLVHVCCICEVTLNLTSEIFHTYLQAFRLFRAALILYFSTVVQLFYLLPCFPSLINVDSLPLATFRKPSKAAHYTDVYTLQKSLWNFSFSLLSSISLKARFFIRNSGMRMVGTECHRNILFNPPLGAEWMAWRSVYSRIWMRNERTRAFHILAILIPELWIKKRAVSTTSFQIRIRL